ncbi:MAG: TraB/GumN family protein [Helicobacteraceae bacterium]|jgi:uncharacterized protein YbaP (TraB family)|nr:TraB/GumN family protein [Helicobacteraceae bacterium]
MGLARFSAFCLAALLFCGGAWAKTSVETTADTAARYPFYLAQKGSVKIYVLGSMHLGKLGEALNQKIVSALRHSSKLVLEVAPSELKSVKIDDLLCEAPCLKETIGEELFERILERYPATRFMSDELERMPLWYVGALLSVFDYMEERFLPQYGTEELLARKAKGIKIEGLESANEQFEAMASISTKTQIELLEVYLNCEPAQLKQYLSDMYALFLEGDADRLYKWYATTNLAEGVSQAATDEFNEKLIFARNARFAERLKARIDGKKPIFLAIGALHLGGDKGVLELLRKEGYKIKRL